LRIPLALPKKEAMRYFLAVFVISPAFAQSLSFGVKGGAPLTDAFSTSKGDRISYASVTRRYTVGPTAEIGLPLFGLRLEVDALYRRIGWNGSGIATPLFDAFQSTTRFSAWDFDALLKQHIGGAGILPYVGAGAAFRRLFTTRTNYVFPGPPPGFLTEQMTAELNHKNIAGFVLSGGIELGVGALRVAPEFRYTRWLMNNIHHGFPNLSTQANQAEILVSFTFGRHR
jgi:hypothetical protein